LLKLQDELINIYCGVLPSNFPLVSRRNTPVIFIVKVVPLPYMGFCLLWESWSTVYLYLS